MGARAAARPRWGDRGGSPYERAGGRPRGARGALDGRGRDLKVEVEFDDAEVGTKLLLVAYAALERDWEGA